MATESAEQSTDSEGTPCPSPQPETKETTQVPTLTTLSWSDILFCRVLPLLSWEDLFHLREVSFQCKQLVDEYFQQLKSIDLSKAGREITSEAFKVVTGECANLRELRIHNAHRLCDDDLKPVFKRNPLLSLLDLTGCTLLNGSCLLPLSVNCKDLSTLILRDCHWLSHGAVDTLITHLHSLEKADFSSCSALSNQQILPFVVKFRGLRELRLAYVPAVNDTSLLGIARNCGDRLNILDIRGCGNVTDRGVTMIAEYCEKLESLYVATCNLVTEYSLRLLRERGVRIDRERAGELVPYVPFPVQT